MNGIAIPQPENPGTFSKSSSSSLFTYGHQVLVILNLQRPCFSMCKGFLGVLLFIKHFLYATLFNPHNKPWKAILLSFPPYTEETEV